MMRRLSLLLLAAAAAVILIWLLAGSLDRAAYDAISQSAFRRARPPRVPVVLVALDEETVQSFPEPLALWQRHWRDLFMALASAHPRAIALDFVLPPRASQGVLLAQEEPAGLPVGGQDLDAALFQGLWKAAQTCPTVLGVDLQPSSGPGPGRDDGRLNPRPLNPLYLTAVGKERTGLLHWVRDPDGTSRTLHEFPGSRTLAGQVALALGREPRSGRLDYGVGQIIAPVSFRQVIEWKRAGNSDQLQSAFAGKIVVIGAVLPYEDRISQAVDLRGPGGTDQQYPPGCLLHVQALGNLLDRGPLKASPLWVVLAGMVISASASWWGATRGVKTGLALWLFLLGGIGGLTVVLYGAGWWWSPAESSLVATAFMAVPVLQELRLKLQERMRLRGVFRGYVSPEMLKKILSGRFPTGLGGSRTHVCVMFTDLRGFTTFSQGRDPEYVIKILNRMYERLVPAIHKAGGCVDKYMGDGMMAQFGYPVPIDHPSRSAFQAAVNMLDAMKSLNAEFAAEGLPPLKLGIGLHFGEVLVGNIGSNDRFEFTAIGDTTNTASRLEGLTKTLGFDIVVSDPVAQELTGIEGLVSLGLQPIRGRDSLDLWGWSPTQGWQRPASPGIEEASSP